MAQITINEGLAWLKTLKKRHEELLTLRNDNAHRERRFYGSLADREIVKEPVYDVKGVVEALAQSLGVELEYQPAKEPYLVEGRSAEVSSGPRVGVVGQILPSIVAARGLPPGEELWAFELDVDTLAERQAPAELRAESLPRYPSVVRDLSILVDSTLPAAAVRGTIRTEAPSLLARVVEFDRYRGKGVPEGRVSLSLRLTFRSPERTLTDAEVDAAMDRILAALVTAHDAVRR